MFHVFIRPNFKCSFILSFERIFVIYPMKVRLRVIVMRVKIMFEVRLFIGACVFVCVHVCACM